MDTAKILGELAKCGMLDTDLVLIVRAGADDVVRKALWERKACRGALTAAGIPIGPQRLERPSDSRIQELCDMSMLGRGLDPVPCEWVDRWYAETADIDEAWEAPLWGAAYPFGQTDMGLPGRIARYLDTPVAAYSPLVELAQAGVWAFGPSSQRGTFMLVDPNPQYVPLSESLEPEE